MSAVPHHSQLLFTLLAEVERLSPGAMKKNGPKISSLWSTMTEERKRSLLRALVTDIRNAKKLGQDFAERRVASLLNLGIEGMKGFYRLTPQEALDRAYTMIVEMGAAKEGLRVLGDLNLQDQLSLMPGKDQDTIVRTMEEFQEGYNALENKLKDTLVGGFSQLIVLISRAGGHELTEVEEAELERSWEQVREMAKGHKLTVV